MIDPSVLFNETSGYPEHRFYSMLHTEHPICVIEDQQTDLFVLTQQLEQIGGADVAIVSFSTLAQALAWKPEKPPQIILADLNLPDSNGLETFFRLHKAFRAAPVIVMSGVGDDAVANQALANGAQDYLVKGSYNLEMLERAIRYALGRNTTIRELEAAKNQAEWSERVMQEFLTNVSHEMRTPMNVISGMADLLLDAQLQSEQVEQVRAIRSASDNLLVLVNDLLDLSKMETGQLELLNIAFSPQKLVQDIARGMELLAQSKGLAFEVKVKTAVPEVVKSDPNRIRQILLNLLNNAIKFTERGRVGIELTAGDGYLQFAVSDTGAGIAPEHINAVFERFNRGNNAQAKQYAGTGIGLSIVKQLTEAFDGDLTVDSEVGKGSIFTVVLPVRAALQANVQVQLLKEEAPSMENLAVLLAEDYPLNQLVIRQFFEKRGATVTLAKNGVEAVAQATENAFDVVLMDVRMPEMNGLEATQAIRNLPNASRSAVPIIALTANATQNEINRCYQAGMNGYHAKPVDFEELCKQIQAVVAVGAITAAPEQPVLQPTSLLAELQRTYEADTELVLRVAHEFLNTVPTHATELFEALENNNRNRAIELAHKLINPVSIVGFHELSKQFRSLEIALQQQQTQEIQTLSSAIKQTFEPAVQQLTHEVERLKATA